ncbi:MAG: Uncharacterized protein FD165_153 [Gammaproteobacteria bacterium]|nr:MAG: Uncharacterized protein FD165_153 [Gammaproteobacteria bacterium]TND06731.1 MAG: Uncharacterized protein FD120_463 [Gammaproteobacteria bacterium]
MKLRNYLAAGVATGFGVLFVNGAACADDALEQRVRKLETELQLSREEIQQSRQQQDVDVSGYVDFEYSGYSETPGKESAFRLHHLSLFFTKQLAEKWRFFSEIEYEDGSNFEGPETAGVLKSDDGKIFVEAVNTDFLYDSRANLRVGRFFTPAGIWSIDHYPPFVPTQVRPQHIRKIFPQLVDGLMVYGTLPAGDSFVNYDAYIGNGEGNSGAGDSNSEKALGAKISVVFPALDLEVGGTIYRDEKDTGNANADKTAAGVHAKLSAGGFTGQFEYAAADLTPAGGGSDDEVEGWYLQILYDLSNWTFGLRHDVYDSDKDNPVTLTEDTVNSVFVNYHVSPTMVIKLEHHVTDDASDPVNDPTQTMASMAIFLGD